MNLFEIFDNKKTKERTYYQAKKPLAVILILLGIASMFLCTPAGAAFIQSWLIETIPSIATAISWCIAIAFDLTFAYLLHQMFCDIFSGMDKRRTYWDIPTMVLVVIFGGTTLCWSFWGGDIRKSVASKEFARTQRIALDSSFTAMVALTQTKGKTTKTTKDMTRNARKSNEALAELAAANLGHTQALEKITEAQIKNAEKEEIHRHKIIDNGKLIILGAYLFLVAMIACVEYIKSRKDGKTSRITEAEEPNNIIPIVKKKTKQQRAKKLRSEGLSFREIGNKMGVTHTSARRYCNA